MQIFMKKSRFFRNVHKMLKSKNFSNQCLKAAIEEAFIWGGNTKRNRCVFFTMNWMALNQWHWFEKFFDFNILSTFLNNKNKKENQREIIIRKKQRTIGRLHWLMKKKKLNDLFLLNTTSILTQQESLRYRISTKSNKKCKKGGQGINS